MAGAVEIVSFSEKRRYFYLLQVGPYFDANPIFDRLVSEFDLAGLNGRVGDFVCIRLDDPEVVSADKLRSRVGVFASNDAMVPLGLEEDSIVAGKFAKMIHHGSYSELKETWKFLYGVWFPHSGEKVRQGIPAFEIHPDRDKNIAEEDQITELYICLL